MPDIIGSYYMENMVRKPVLYPPELWGHALKIAFLAVLCNLYLIDHCKKSQNTRVFQALYRSFIGLFILGGVHLISLRLLSGCSLADRRFNRLANWHNPFEGYLFNLVTSKHRPGNRGRVKPSCSILNAIQFFGQSRCENSTVAPVFNFLDGCGEKETTHTPPYRGNHHPMSNGSFLLVYNWIAPVVSRELLNRCMATNLLNYFNFNRRASTVLPFLVGPFLLGGFARSVS